jgi:hypothetical protein
MAGMGYLRCVAAHAGQYMRPSIFSYSPASAAVLGQIPGVLHSTQTQKTRLGARRGRSVFGGLQEPFRASSATV